MIKRARKLLRIVVPPEVLLLSLRALEDWPDYVRLTKIRLSDEAAVESIVWSDDRRAWIATVSSPDFSEVPDGEVIPFLDCEGLETVLIDARALESCPAYNYVQTTASVVNVNFNPETGEYQVESHHDN